MNRAAWNLWRLQLAAILRLEIKRNFLARRGLWIYMLALAPAALFWVHGALALRDRRVCDLGRDSLVFAAMFQFFYLRLAIFFGCVGVFLNLFRGEMLEKSLHYYLLTPVRREVLLAGKYVAGVITTSVIFASGTALALAAEQFAELYNRLPLDDATIAQRLGITRQQVINLRKAARDRLVRRMRSHNRKL